MTFTIEFTEEQMLVFVGMFSLALVHIDTLESAKFGYRLEGEITRPRGDGSSAKTIISKKSIEELGRFIGVKTGWNERPKEVSDEV